MSLKIGPKLVCPYCGEEPDMEIGPDEEMPVAKETAKLLEMVKVRKMWNEWMHCFHWR